MNLPGGDRDGDVGSDSYAAHSADLDDQGALFLPAAGVTGVTIQTDLDRDAAEMQHSERRYRRLFEAARDGILLLDVDTGRITDANPFMSELLGYPKDDLLGKELWEIGLFADQEASQIAFRHLQAEGYIRYEDLPLEASQGERREVEFVSNVYRENGKIVIQCNIRDITDRKRIEHALQAALARELRITKALQYSLTAEVAEEAFPDLLVAACYEPALKEAEVGGDFFDAFSLRASRDGTARNDGHCPVVLAVGDVTGKGLHAAVLAGRVKEVLRAYLHEDPDPARTLVRLNDYLCDPVSNSASGDRNVDTRAFISLVIGVVDVQAGYAVFSAAGAESPAVIEASGAVQFVETGGCLLGVYPDAAYTNTQVPFHAGDMLLMATDGITEARNFRDGERGSHKWEGRPDLLGNAGMVAIALQHLGLPSIRAISQAIVEDARAFGDGFHDDVCLLLARRR